MTWLWQPAPPGVPPQYVWLGALMAVAAAMFAYVRKMRPQPIVNAMLLSMRLATIAVVAVILMGPSKQAPAGPAQARQPLVMLLDISASMLTEDCNGMSRFRYAADQWLAADRLDRLGLRRQAREKRRVGDVRRAFVPRVPFAADRFDGAPFV